MFNKISTVILLSALPAVLFASKTTDDEFKIGNPNNATNKVLGFDIGNGAGNPQIRANDGTELLEFSNDGINFFPIGSGGDGATIQLLSNPGYEVGLGTWSNVGSGSLVLDTDAADVFLGNHSALFDAAAASDRLDSEAVTVPGGLRGNLCSVEMQYKGGDSHLELQAYDGSEVLAKVSLEASADNFTKASVTFTCPTSGTIQGRLVASADAAAVNVDQWVVGKSGDLIDLVSTTKYQNTVANDSFYTGSGSLTVTSTTTNRYRHAFIGGNIVVFDVDFTGALGGSASNTIKVQPPIPVANGSGVLTGSVGFCSDGGGAKNCFADIDTTSGEFRIRQFDDGNFATGSGSFQAQWIYEVDPANAPASINPVQKVETSAVYAEVFFGITELGGSTGSAIVSDANNPMTIKTDKGLSPQVLCVGNPSGTTTCPVGDEVLGFEFQAPKSGVVHACVTGNYRFNDNGSLGLFDSEFRMVQVSTDGNLTELNEVGPFIEISNDKNPSGNQGGDFYNFGGCGLMEVNAGSNGLALKKNIDVFTNGIAGSHELRNVRFSIFPVTQQLPQVIAINDVPLRYARKTLTANFFTPSSEISDLTFTNMPIGETFRIRLECTFRNNTSAGAELSASVFDGDLMTGQNLGGCTDETTDFDSAGPVTNSHSFEIIHTFQTSRLSVNSNSSFQTSTGLRGDSPRFTFIEIEHIPNPILTNEWD